MAMTATPVYEQTLFNQLTAIANAQGTTAQTIVTPGTNGTRIKFLSVSNTDTSAYTVNLFLVISSTSYLLATLSVAASSGNAAGTLPVNLLTTSLIPGLAHDPSGNPYLDLASGTTLTAATTSTVTSGKQLAFSVTGWSF
jgi:hypothetical protein